jgi:hypothetical protein
VTLDNLEQCTLSSGSTGTLDLHDLPQHPVFGTVCTVSAAHMLRGKPDWSSGAPSAAASNSSLVSQIATLQTQVAALKRGQPKPTPTVPPLKQRRGDGTLVKQPVNPPPAIARTLGSEAHMVVYCDAAGNTQQDDSKNVMIKVLFNTPKQAKRADLDKEFGPALCKPPMFSMLFGKSRFSFCDNASHPDHATSSSPAHQYPKNYRQRLQQHFC